MRKPCTHREPQKRTPCAKNTSYHSYDVIAQIAILHNPQNPMLYNHILIIGSVCLCEAASVGATVSASINPLPSDRLRCCDRYIRSQRSLAVKPLKSQRDADRPSDRPPLTAVWNAAGQPAQRHWQWAGISLPLYDIGLPLLGVRDDSHVQHYTDWRHKAQSREAQLWLVLFNRPDTLKCPLLWGYLHPM